MPPRGIGNRTTIADGNTWNHEHIATLGRILSSPEKRAHAIAKHLADYVLVWAGGGGDDLAKSPHMARIGNSVYGDICPGDPTCSQFGFYHGGRPTKMMEECLLYKMCLSGQHGVKPLNASLFREVFSSKYGKVKIFKQVMTDFFFINRRLDVLKTVCVQGGQALKEVESVGRRSREPCV